jgi:poly(3-hydroxybutyrate) depolymerase
MGNSGPKFPGLLWPALAAEAASEIAAVAAKGLLDLAIGSERQREREQGPEPEWATPNRVALELTTVRLRDFSTSGRQATPTLACAPFALHGSCVADFAPQHSLVESLKLSGLDPLYVTDWRSASADMRFLSIDDYLSDLNVLVDELGGTANLIGLCQGGWLGLIYAARFPDKVGKLVLAGAPIDIEAGSSQLSELARRTPIDVFQEMIELGGGRACGAGLLQFWGPNAPDTPTLHWMLQPSDAIDAAAFLQLEARFREWYAWTVDLPGSYYLQVVEQLFKENRLAGGSFVALGRRISLANVRCPVYLLAARDDEVVAPQQLLSVQRLIGSRQGAVRTTIAPCNHLGLFMSRRVLTDVWPEIARWLSGPVVAPARHDN